MADSNLTQLRYVEESTRGTTPSSALSTLRVVSAQFEDERTRETDQDLGLSRARDVVTVMNQARGNIEARLRYGNLDNLFEGVLNDDWETDGVSSGIDRLQDNTTQHYFTFEKDIADVGSSFMSWTGHAVDQMTVNIAPDQKVSVSLQTIGNSGATGSSTVGTGAAGAAVTTAEMVGGDISAFLEGGGALSRVAGLQFTVGNALRRSSELGSLEPGGSSNDMGLGRFSATGTLRAYFANFTLYTKFRSLTATSIKATIADAAGNSYAFHFPEVRYVNNGRILAGGGINQDVIVELPFVAIHDTTETAAVVLERDAA